jgi:hypothetical protein
MGPAFAKALGSITISEEKVTQTVNTLGCRSPKAKLRKSYRH